MVPSPGYKLIFFKNSLSCPAPERSRLSPDPGISGAAVDVVRAPSAVRDEPLRGGGDVAVLLVASVANVFVVHSMVH